MGAVNGTVDRQPQRRATTMPADRLTSSLSLSFSFPSHVFASSFSLFPKSRLPIGLLLVSLVHASLAPSHFSLSRGTLLDRLASPPLFL